MQINDGSKPFTQLDYVQMERAERSLKQFAKQAWHVIEPGHVYRPNWHIDAICDHLQAVTCLDIKRLLINIPPRCMKSLLVSVFWPTWVWIAKPEFQWLYTSYAEKLSVRDNVKSRRIIQSKWFQSRWGHRFKLTGDQNEKIKFENDRRGYRLATSVGGKNTGEGGDNIVVDDPHNVIEGESDTIRNKTLDFWDETMSSRLNDQKTGAKIIVMQRVHQKDLSGHVIAKNAGYVHLCLPMEFEPKTRCVTSLPFKDPRKEFGELLWPDRFDADVVEDLKNECGQYAYAGQYGQLPAPRGGGMFKGENIKIVTAAPRDALRIRYWDMAATEEEPGKDPDYTVGLLLAVKAKSCFVEDVVRFRKTPKDTEDKIKRVAIKDGPRVSIVMEQEPGSSGKIVIDHYASTVIPDGYTFRGDKSSDGKVIRATPVAAASERGDIKMVQGDWNHDFIDELETFPASTHKDQTDALSGAYNSKTKAFFNSDNSIVIKPFEIPMDWTRWRAMKWGKFGETYSIGWYAMSPDGVTYRYRELSGKCNNADQVCRDLIKAEEKERKHDVVFKNSPAIETLWNKKPGQNSVSKTFKDYGIKWIKAKQDPKTQENGWFECQRVITEKKFKVFDRCKEFIDVVPFAPENFREIKFDSGNFAVLEEFMISILSRHKYRKPERPKLGPVPGGFEDVIKNG